MFTLTTIKNPSAVGPNPSITTASKPKKPKFYRTNETTTRTIYDLFSADIWDGILRFVSLVDRLQLRLVCRDLRDVSDRLWSQVREYDMETELRNVREMDRRLLMAAKIRRNNNNKIEILHHKNFGQPVGDPTGANDEDHKDWKRQIRQFRKHGNILNVILQRCLPYVYGLYLRRYEYDGFDSMQTVLTATDEASVLRSLRVRRLEIGRALTAWPRKDLLEELIWHKDFVGTGIPADEIILLCFSHLMPRLRKLCIVQSADVIEAFRSARANGLIETRFPCAAIHHLVRLDLIRVRMRLVGARGFRLIHLKVLNLDGSMLDIDQKRSLRSNNNNRSNRRNTGAPPGIFDDLNDEDDEIESADEEDEHEGEPQIRRPPTGGGAAFLTEGSGKNMISLSELMPNLESFTFSYNYVVRPFRETHIFHDLIQLKKLRTLRYDILNHKERLIFSTLRAAVKKESEWLRSLRQVHLSSDRIEITTAYLGEFEGLRCISLRLPVTGVELKRIGFGCSQLTHLILQQSNLRLDGLLAVKEAFRALQYLDIRQCRHLKLTENLVIDVADSVTEHRILVLGHRPLLDILCDLSQWRREPSNPTRRNWRQILERKQALVHHKFRVLVTESLLGYPSPQIYEDEF